MYLRKINRHMEIIWVILVNQSSHGNNMGNTGIVQSSTMRASWGSISSLITVPRSQEGVLIWMEEVLHQ